MAMIGNPIVSTDFPVDYKSGNGSTTAFTLSVAPASVNSIDVQISGVSQSPQTYSVSGTTLTFSAAPPTGTNNIVVRHLGIAGIPNVPAAGSVVPASIGTGYALWNLSGSDINYTAGNVGIGISSPSFPLHVYKLANGNIAQFSNGSDADLYINLTSGVSRISPSTGTLALGTLNTERMRIDSSGVLFVGTTAQIGPAKIVTTQSTTGWSAIACNHSLGSGERFISFANAANNALIGSITNNGNTGVSYNTTSDYRLKENVAPMQNALGVVQQLKPVTYTWKSDGSAGQGFIAHELQAVVPDCVTGEKDAVDAEGKPVYQGIDTSFLVATLTAAIQELKAELDATKAEVALLKAGV